MDQTPMPGQGPESPEQNVQPVDVPENSDGSEDMPDEVTDERADPVANLSWQASEYVHHQKQPIWYFGVIVIAVGLMAAGLLMQQWSGVVVLVAMTAAVLVYANKAPRTLGYELTDEGIVIESKFHPYSQFKSFAVISDVAWHTIDLDPVKRFAPRLTILFEDKDLNEIVAALSKELPQVYRQPDFVERLTRFLKF